MNSICCSAHNPHMFFSFCFYQPYTLLWAIERKEPRKGVRGIEHGKVATFQPNIQIEFFQMEYVWKLNEVWMFRWTSVKRFVRAAHFFFYWRSVRKLVNHQWIKCVAHIYLFQFAICTTFRVCVFGIVSHCA